MVSFLLVFLMVSSCKKHVAKKRTLHNYPIFDGQDCPDTYSEGRYDPHKVAKEAAILNMRPVDYLHAINNKRYKPVRKPDEITKFGPYTLE